MWGAMGSRCAQGLQDPSMSSRWPKNLHLLGVRRDGVTECTLRLQAAGLIRYVRRHISVLDRAGLE